MKDSEKQIAGFIAKFEPAVAAVLRSCRAAGRGYTMVKSVSPKQRPRRAALAQKAPARKATARKPKKAAAR